MNFLLSLLWLVLVLFAARRAWRAIDTRPRTR